MSARPNDVALKQIGRLFRDGTSVGLGDGDLLARFVARRDEAAFEALVSRHGPMVLGVCRRMLSDPHDADDAFQATFLVLVRKARGIRDADRLAPWLYGVAHRVAGRARTRANRRAAKEKVGTEIEPSVRPAFNDLTDVRSIIDAEVARLSAKYREVLVLCLLEGLTTDEAAARLHCPPGTVRSRLARGRETLKGRLSARGLAPALAASAVLGSADLVRACSVPERLLIPLLQAAADPINPLAGIGIGIGAATLTREAMQPMFSKTVKFATLLTLGMGVGGVGIVETVRSTAQARPSQPEPQATTPFATSTIADRDAQVPQRSGNEINRPSVKFASNPGTPPIFPAALNFPGMPGPNRGGKSNTKLAGFPGMGFGGGMPGRNGGGFPGMGMPGMGFGGNSGAGFGGKPGAGFGGFPGMGNGGGFPGMGFGGKAANKDSAKPGAGFGGFPGMGFGGNSGGKGAAKPGAGFGGFPGMNNGGGLPGMGFGGNADAKGADPGAGFGGFPGMMGMGQMPGAGNHEASGNQEKGDAPAPGAGFGGFPGGGFGGFPGMPGAAAENNSALEKRLENVEHKLDELLKQQKSDPQS